MENAKSKIEMINIKQNEEKIEWVKKVKKLD